MAAVASSRDGTLAKLRSLARALPGTRETPSWGHPNFRTSARIFAAFHESRDGVPTLWLRLDPLAVELLRDDPRSVPSGHARLGWLGVRMDGRIPWRRVRELLADAHALAEPKPERGKTRRR